MRETHPFERCHFAHSFSFSLSSRPDGNDSCQWCVVVSMMSRTRRIRRARASRVSKGIASDCIASFAWMPRIRCARVNAFSLYRRLTSKSARCTIIRHGSRKCPYNTKRLGSRILTHGGILPQSRVGILRTWKLISTQHLVWGDGAKE